MAISAAQCARAPLGCRRWSLGCWAVRWHRALDRRVGAALWCCVRLGWVRPAATIWVIGVMLHTSRVRRQTCLRGGRNLLGTSLPVCCEVSSRRNTCGSHITQW